jgi:SAM-dependent methyltransferase
MTALPRDYDSDPQRFLADSSRPHDDVHPYVADRFAAAGVRRVLDVGGGSGRLARLLPGRSMRCVVIDLSPAMLALAPRPAVRADGARLPVADASVDAVAALYTLYHFDDPVQPLREARRVLHSGGLLAACAPARDSAPELARVVPSWGARSTFDAENAPDVVASAFSAPGDRVEVDRWDGPLRTLSSFDEAIGFLRCHGMSDGAAREAAAGLELPLILTMRGCVVYATKG